MMRSARLAYGLKPDDVLRIGHEVRQRVDVVERVATIAGVDEVLDTADVHAGGRHQATRLVDDLGRRVVGLDGQSAAGHAVGRAGQLAVVRRAEVEGPRREQQADGVQELAVQELDAHDRVTLGGEVLLEQADVVDPEVEPTAVHRRGPAFGEQPGGGAPRRPGSDDRIRQRRQCAPSVMRRATKFQVRLATAAAYTA